MRRWQHAVGALGLVLLLVGCAVGLLEAPAERHMGDVSRIVYIHVPTSWSSLICYTVAFACALGLLWTSNPRWDDWVTGAIETGVVLNVLVLLSGMIFARPTWGIWWTWDARLTLMLLAAVLFGGILGMRAFLDDGNRRATLTAVAAIVAYADIPLVYFSVRWWRTIHQSQSSPDTVDSRMVLPLRINAFALLFLAIWLMAARAELERRRRQAAESAEPAPLTE